MYRRSLRAWALALLSVIVATASFVFIERTSSQRLSKEETDIPTANGTVTVKVTSNLPGNITPTDTASIRKQFFTGSTNCSTGGGAITDVTGVNSGAGHVISLSAADSVLIQTFPYSDRNAGVQGLQFPDNNTVDFLPDNKYCVHGFNDVNHNANIVVTPAVQALAFDTGSNSCTTTPKYLFNAGEKVCLRFTGTGGSGATPWKVNFFGGRNNSCNLFFDKHKVTS
jgi:hypothetical protein